MESGQGSTARGRSVRRVGQVVEDGAQLGRAEADGAGGAQQLRRGDRRAERVVREHVREADEGGVALGVVGVVALDRGGDGARQVPAAGEHAADQRVVDAELAALVVQALLRRAGRAVDLLRVARVGVHEHELADVVQQRGDQQAVAVRRSRRRRRAGRRRAGRRRRAGGSARARRPTSCRARRTRRSRWRRRGPGRPRARAPRRRRRCSRPGRGAGSRRCWRGAGRRSRARRRTRWPATTSPVEGRSSETSASTRLRDSASAGNSSSASKAAVRRLPWPSLRDGPTSAYGSPGRWRGAAARVGALAADRDGVMALHRSLAGDLEVRAGAAPQAPFSAYRQTWTNG